MASWWLSHGDSEVSGDTLHAKEVENNIEEDACTMIMRLVVVRSSGIGSSKRAWVKPPSEVQNPRKASQANSC